MGLILLLGFKPNKQEIPENESFTTHSQGFL